MAFRFELNTSGDGLGEVDATLTYETDDTLELSHQEETGKEGEEERTREGPVGKKRALEVCRSRVCSRSFMNWCAGRG